ncbi:MAG: BadF/BadG/BcrA/BcrD ATPase family protein [Candidatus Acidiferrum sp.]
MRVGAEAARLGLQVAIQQTCENARIPRNQIAHTCIGCAGISASKVTSTLKQFISEEVSGSIEVVGDHHIAFEAAFGDEPGVLVEVGTGSIVFGRNAKGQSARAGGHGFAISDEGSGYWIGRMAVSLTLRALDCGHKTLLLPLILQEWQVPQKDLVKAANSCPAPDCARLYPLVLEAERDGDEVASLVLRRASVELAQLAQVVLGRLSMTGSARVAMAGGVFENSEHIRMQFADALGILWPSAEVLPTLTDPLLGALSLARKRQQ